MGNFLFLIYWQGEGAADQSGTLTARAIYTVRGTDTAPYRIYGSNSTPQRVKGTDTTPHEVN